jgi:ParB family chromosome partitioning protein
MSEIKLEEEVKMSKQVLGKGLSALLSGGGEDLEIKENTQPYQMSLDLIRPGSSQPRGIFEEDSLLELSESIKKNGVLQPILVRKNNQGYFEIIAGERRFRAAKLAGLQNVPVIVRDFNDAQALEVALIENIQRENLTPIEEADGYKRLQEEFGYTQEQLGGILGKSRSHVTNMLRLLTLPNAIKEMLSSGVITMGHARVLVGVADPQVIAERIVREGLSVRESEKLAAGSGHAGGGAKGREIHPGGGAFKRNKDEDLLALERSLSESIGLKVTVEDGKDGGRVILYFSNLTELDKILQKLG